LTIAGAIMGSCDLAVCAGVLVIGNYRLGRSVEALQTLTLVMLVFIGQAIFYVVRQRRRLRSSRSRLIVILSPIADVLIVPTLAIRGILMAPLPASVVAGFFVTAIALAFALDVVKVAIFGRLKMV
jgi:H+-transporting ATPase